jgi:glycosidase
MKNKKVNTDATVREDFPGGWKEDATNRFTNAGRSAKENEVFNYTGALANFRKNSSAITSGRTMQFIPKDGVYIYFRYDNKQTIMVITNTGDKPVKPDWNYYTERTAGFKQMKDVVSGNSTLLQGFEIKPKESFVFELMK